MTAKEALDFIHQKLWIGSKPGLSRTLKLLSLMGNPEKDLSFIHIAGTNGKGSVSAMLSSVLTAAGFKTGLYTSPFITRFNERMQVNGVPISDTELAEITEFCAPFALSMEDDRPTEFELVTAVAFEFFKRKGCDFVVLETGMGGRLDSTNVIKSPVCSVITNIGLDHTKELGDTIEKIAAEKAGIIKDNCPTVIYDLPESVCKVIETKCKECSSSLYKADFSEITEKSYDTSGQTFTYKDTSNIYKLPLLGEHQLKNASVVLEIIDVLRKSGVELPEYAVKNGIASVKWPARFEIISDAPTFIVDGGHNPQCAETVRDNLKRLFPKQKKVILLGILADKDYESLLRILDETADAYVLITPPSPRALSSKELLKYVQPLGKPASAADSIEEGIELALNEAGKDGVVCAVGSLYSAGEIRSYFGK